MQESISLTIKGLSIVTQGTNSNGPWHLYGVEDTEDKKHSTFLEGLEIGKTYQFLREMKPYVSKRDGKTYQGSNLVGFDNVAYEAKHERPATTPKASEAPQSKDGFTEADRKILLAIYTYLSGEPR